MAVQIGERAPALGVALIGCDYLSSLGLRQALERSSFLLVVGESPGMRDTAPLLGAGSIDLILVDAVLGAVELIRICEELSRSNMPRTVVVLGNVDHDLAEQLIIAGVTAIIRRKGITEDLPTVLRVIHEGETLILSARAHHFLRPRAEHGDKFRSESYGLLSLRERAVAKGVAEGLSNATIARHLYLSEAAIKLLISSIMVKFGVCNRVQIAVRVTQTQLNSNF